jgi:hypothetical protein
MTQKMAIYHGKHTVRKGSAAQGDAVKKDPRVGIPKEATLSHSFQRAEGGASDRSGRSSPGRR